jgi:hypothetical protein
MKKAMMLLIILGISMILLGIIIEFIDMMIDHNCYQLEPNEFYQSTICERYWKYEERS